MLFQDIKYESSENFHRFTGIDPVTFNFMKNILGKNEFLLKSKGGRPNKLSIENRLLMSLAYWREYRTYFHISKDYGISESTCFRNIQWVEDTLINSEEFSLPGKSALLNTNISYEVILGVML